MCDRFLTVVTVPLICQQKLFGIFIWPNTTAVFTTSHGYCDTLESILKKKSSHTPPQTTTLSKRNWMTVKSLIWLIAKKRQITAWDYIEVTAWFRHCAHQLQWACMHPHPCAFSFTHERKRIHIFICSWNTLCFPHVGNRTLFKPSLVTKKKNIKLWCLISVQGYILVKKLVSSATEWGAVILRSR